MKASVAVLTLILMSLLFPLLIPVKAYYEGFTHAVYIENVTATWCPTCRKDQPLISKAVEKYSGSLHIVEFHVTDDWDNGYGLEKAKQYDTTLTPTHAYDAGYSVKVGTINEEIIEATGRRDVHRVTLAILKRVEGSTLSFEGSIKEEDGEPFDGKILVVAAENDLQSGGITWNSVFRGYLLDRAVTLRANAYSLFSGSWSIPGNVNSSNIELVAAAFDFADRTDMGGRTHAQGGFTVQSVSDVDSGMVIPEFKRVFVVTGVLLASTIQALRSVSKSRNTSRLGTNSSRYVKNIVCWSGLMRHGTAWANV